MYRNYEIHDISILPEVIAHYKLDGFNVTIPYKESVISLLDLLDPDAAAVGAVNCVKVRQGKLVGFNTDIIGFEYVLSGLIDLQKEHKALIFGNGGASRAVKFVLDKHGIPYRVVTRKLSEHNLTYSTLDETHLQAHDLLINTTPVGMFPGVEEVLELPYHAVSDKHIAYDLIYNPEKTRFLAECEKRGARIMNGYNMLIRQAEESLRIFEQDE